MTADAPPGVVMTLRSLPRPMITLLVGVAVNRLGSLFPLFLVLYATSTGSRPAAAGLLLTAYGGGSIAGVVLGGWVTDRGGARAAIVGSMGLLGGLMGAVPLVSDYPVLLVLCAAVGVLTEMYRPAVTTLLADCAPADSAVVVAATYRWALNAGATLAPLLGAALAVHSLRLVFVADAVTSLAFAGLAAAQLPAGTGRRRDGTATEGTAIRGTGASPLRDAPFRRVLVGMFLIGAIEVQYLSTLPLSLSAHGFGVRAYSGVVSLNGLLVLALELPLVRLTRHWRMRTSIALGVGLLGGGIALLGLARGLVVLVVATLVWTTGEMVSAPAATAYPALVAPPASRGRYVAAMGASQSLGYALGPAAGTALLVRAGDGLWPVCAAAAVVVTLLMWTGVRVPAPCWPGRPAGCRTEAAS